MFHDEKNGMVRLVGRVVVALALAAFTGTLAFAADDAFADKPYMGWTSWSFYGKSVNMGDVQKQADYMINNLFAYGYTYINIDSGWRDGVDSCARAKADTSKFPTGIAGAATYVHNDANSKTKVTGLKIGIYLVPGIAVSAYDANDMICGTSYTVRDIAIKSEPGNTLGAGNSDSTYAIDFTKVDANTGKLLGDEYLQTLADLVAEWGVDFIKLDFVGPGGGLDGKVNTTLYVQHLHKALQNNASHRNIWLELSNSLNINYAKQWWVPNANGWRIDGDVERNPLWGRVLTRFTDAPKWAQYAGPGGWNDLDAVMVGLDKDTPLTETEDQTVFTLWSISCAPLYLGADMTSFSGKNAGLLPLITNPEVIAVDQAGHVATPALGTEGKTQQIWSVQNPDGTYIVALFNLDSKSDTISVPWAKLGITDTPDVRDLWARKDLGRIATQYSAEVSSNGSVLLKVTP